jgi:hypothetical protein
MTNVFVENTNNYVNLLKHITIIIEMDVFLDNTNYYVYLLQHITIIIEMEFVQIRVLVRNPTQKLTTAKNINSSRISDNVINNNYNTNVINIYE